MDKNNTRAFIETLNDTIKSYEKDIIQLKKTDFLIIKSLYDCMLNITTFKVPYVPEEYTLYNKRASKDNNDLNISTSFEYDFSGYSKDILVSSALECSIPFILVLIKNTNKNIEKLSSAIGTKINGDLLFLVKKQNNNWELPTRALSIKEDKVDEVVLFKSIDYSLDLKKTKELLDDARKFYKNEILDLYEKYKAICFSEMESFQVSEKELIYPESFSLSNSNYKHILNMNIINDNANKLFKYNLLFNFSISLKEKEV